MNALRVRSRMAVCAGFALWAAAGCEIHIPEGVYQCGHDADCPPGLYCSSTDNTCQRSGTKPSSATGSGTVGAADGGAGEAGGASGATAGRGAGAGSGGAGTAGVAGISAGTGGIAADGGAGSGVPAGTGGAPSTSGSGGGPAAGSGGPPTTTPLGPSAIATVGSSCGLDGEHACKAHDAIDRLQCKSGTWQPAGTCDGQTRCDTRLGAGQGSCASIPSLCQDKKPLADVCEGTQRRACDEDRVNFVAHDCPGHSHCSTTAAAISCDCDSGYASDGMGNCGVDNCLGNACGVAATHCSNSMNTFSCSCVPGYMSSGAGHPCADIDECATGNVCSAIYPCRNQTPSYMCLGQFADWPMPDSTAGAAVQPSYEAAPETVLDKVTNLMWQRNIPPVYSSVCMQMTTVMNDSCHWMEANTYCASSNFGGYSDWRLPSKIELESLLDLTRSNPSIDPVAFPQTPVDGYWSSSPYTMESTPGAYWYTNFENGWSYFGQGVFETHRARCVRGPKGSP